MTDKSCNDHNFYQEAIDFVAKDLKIKPIEVPNRIEMEPRIVYHNRDASIEFIFDSKNIAFTLERYFHPLDLTTYSYYVKIGPSKTPVWTHSLGRGKTLKEAFDNSIRAYKESLQGHISNFNSLFP